MRSSSRLADQRGATRSRMPRRAATSRSPSQDGEVLLHGPSVRDVHLPPQDPTAPGQLDDDGALVVITTAVAAHDPTLLGEAVEAPAEARPNETKLVGEFARTGRSTASLQGGKHVEPTEGDVPLGAQPRRRWLAPVRRRSSAALARRRHAWHQVEALPDATRRRGSHRSGRRERPRRLAAPPASVGGDELPQHV